MMSNPPLHRECWQTRPALFTPDGGQGQIAVKVTDSQGTGPAASFSLAAANGQTWWVNARVAAGAIVRHDCTLLDAGPEGLVLNTEASGDTSENETRCTSPRKSSTHKPYHDGKSKSGDDDQSTGRYSPCSHIDCPGGAKDQHGAAEPSGDSMNEMATSPLSSLSSSPLYSPYSSDTPPVSEDHHLRPPLDSSPESI